MHSVHYFVIASLRRDAGSSWWWLCCHHQFYKWGSSISEARRTNFAVWWKGCASRWSQNKVSTDPQNSSVSPADRNEDQVSSLDTQDQSRQMKRAINSLLKWWVMHFWVKDILSVTSGFCHTKYDMIYIKDAITGKYFWDVLNKVRKDYGCWSV